MITGYRRLKNKIALHDVSFREGCLLAIAASLLFWALIVGALIWLI
ncbi:hypothetical protein SM14VA2_48320 (plasmid) [Serratia marcescens]|nr:hypothetical protein SM14VA2_48320 [Serratia marcescens]